MLELTDKFYKPEIVNKFLEGMVLLANGNYSTLWKGKNVSASACPLYRALARHLDMLENLVLIDFDISSVKVIEQSDIVKSMPFNQLHC